MKIAVLLAITITVASFPIANYIKLEVSEAENRASMEQLSGDTVRGRHVVQTNYSGLVTLCQIAGIVLIWYWPISKMWRNVE